MKLQNSTTSPPLRLPPGTIERSGILREWLNHRDKTCHLLLGSAGSGKTTLALQLRRHLVNEGFDVAWMSIFAGDETDVLMETLFAAFQSVAPSICQEIRFLYNRDRANISHNTIAISLIKEIENYGRDLLLVIDDYHNVAYQQAHAILQILLDYAPHNLHILLLSRSVPPLSLERLRSTEKLFELDTQDLRFTELEVEEFLQRNIPNVDREMIAGAMHLTDGWAAGLQLLVLGIKSRPERQKLSQPPLRNVPEFNAYFDQEVLPHLAPEVLWGLVRLSPARRFNEGLAVSLLGARLGHRLLTLLEKERLFIMSADDGRRPGWWRFHPLFRELLLTRFDVLSVTERHEISLALGSWFGDHSQIRDAVQHLVAANDVSQAARYIEQSARTLFLNGELQRLVRAISEVPRPYLRDKHSLTLWLGWTQLCYGQLHACQDSIEKLEQHLATPKKLNAEEKVGATFPGNQGAHITLLKFSLALQVDNLQQAQQMLPEMLDIDDQNDAVLMGGRRNLLAWYYTHEQKFSLSRQQLNGPGHYLDNGQLLVDSSFGSLMSAFFRGLTHLFEADFRNAETSLRTTLSSSERLIGRHCEAACNAAGLLAEVLYEIGDLPALRKLLDGYFDAIERVALPDARLSAALAKSRLLAMDGHLSEAHNALLRMEAVARDRKMLRVTTILLFQHLQVAMQEADSTHMQYLITLQTLSHRASREGHFAAVLIKWHLAMARALSEIKALNYPKAVICLSVLLEARSAPKLLRLKGRALQAICQWGMGHRSVAALNVKSVLQDAMLLGLGRSLVDLGPDFVRLVRAVHNNEATDSLMTFYVNRTFFPMIDDVAVDSRKETAYLNSLSDREAEIVQLLVNSLPNKRIAQALGISPETVKWHLKNVYEKLGVYSREEVSVMARKLI